MIVDRHRAIGCFGSSCCFQSRNFSRSSSSTATGRRHEDIRFLAITTFYDLKRIDATTALYVSGSDVLSPMGHDLTPPSDAQEFLKDHTEFTANCLQNQP